MRPPIREKKPRPLLPITHRSSSLPSCSQVRNWRRDWRNRLAFRPPFRYGWLGNWFVRAMGDDRLPPRNRLRAPRLYQPRPWANPTIGEAVQEFAALQDDFIAIVQAADGLDLARIKIASPITRLLRLSLGQWLNGLSGHQRRHIWQAAQVKKELPH